MINLKTTVIGSQPKPSQLEIPDWFENTGEYDYHKYEQVIDSMDKEIQEKNVQNALKEIIEEQDNIGIDIPTDGEIKRENQILYHVRNIEGVDFSQSTIKSRRGGAGQGVSPTITQEVKCRKHFLYEDWLEASKQSTKPIKMTLPGPMTIQDTIADEYYLDKNKAIDALSSVLAEEMKVLIEAGCTQIQIDEPVIARYPDWALEHGIAVLDRMARDGKGTLEANVTVHICRGQPTHKDQTDQVHADKSSQQIVAAALEACTHIDCISIEDSRDHNGMHNDDELLQAFATKTIVLGVLNKCNTTVESVEAIASRIRHVMRFIPASRLLIAPDCGLAMLPIDVVKQKLKNMVDAVHAINQSDVLI